MKVLKQIRYGCGRQLRSTWFWPCALATTLVAPAPAQAAAQAYEDLQRYMQEAQADSEQADAYRAQALQAFQSNDRDSGCSALSSAVRYYGRGISALGPAHMAATRQYVNDPQTSIQNDRVVSRAEAELEQEQRKMNQAYSKMCR
ncbi:hypothetical protein ACLB0R_04335 [Sphingomonas sp. GlSt437]|uniref:hypothetical protein n=1 Tax=Sphingomonas sp. GlSt437 TaxID=3389970 RepID=UPI003A8AD443